MASLVVVTFLRRRDMECSLHNRRRFIYRAKLRGRARERNARKGEVAYSPRAHVHEILPFKKFGLINKPLNQFHACLTEKKKFQSFWLSLMSQEL